MLINIQVLRGLAALLVFLHHARLQYIEIGGSFTWLQKVADWGFVGVDVFFVISGFVMAYSVQGRAGDRTFLWHFLKKRLLRVYLGYWPFFLMMVGVYAYFSPIRLNDFNLFASFFLLSTNMFELVLPISWSLSYEVYFYGLTALIFLVGRRWFLLGMVSMLVIVLYRTMCLSPVPQTGFGFIFSPFLIEFFLGFLIFIGRDVLLKSNVFWWAMCVAVACLVYGLLAVERDFNGRVLILAMPAAAVVLLALYYEQRSVPRCAFLLKALGDASYTLYLSHLVFLELFMQLGMTAFLQTQSMIFREVSFLGFLVFCVVASYGLYRLFERPLYRLAVTKLASRPLKGL